MILLYLEIHKNIDYVFFTIGFFISSTVHIILREIFTVIQFVTGVWLNHKTWSFIYVQQDVAGWLSGHAVMSLEVSDDRVAQLVAPGTLPNDLQLISPIAQGANLFFWSQWNYHSRERKEWSFNGNLDMSFSALKFSLKKSSTTEVNSPWCEVYSWLAPFMMCSLWFGMNLANSKASSAGTNLSMDPWTVNTL